MLCKSRHSQVGREPRYTFSGARSSSPGTAFFIVAVSVAMLYCQMLVKWAATKMLPFPSDSNPSGMGIIPIAFKVEVERSVGIFTRLVGGKG